MRRFTAFAAVALVSLLAASAALAAFTQTANITLTAKKAGQSSGIKAALASADPTAVGHKPKATSKVVVTFPAKTKFNLMVVKQCKLTDKQLTAVLGAKSCPANAKIGAGTVTANAFPLPGATSLSARVTAFAAGSKQIVLVINHASLAGAPTMVLRAAVSGSTLTIPVSVPPLAGISVVLTSLKLNVPAHGSGRTALITAGKCTAKKFTVKEHFVYADNSTLDLSSSSPCS